MTDDEQSPLDKLRDGIRANRGQVNLLHLVDMNERDHRAALVRVVVARDWAVAMAIFADTEGDETIDADCLDINRHLLADLANLPCAADVIAELLGEP